MKFLIDTFHYDTFSFYYIFTILIVAKIFSIFGNNKSQIDKNSIQAINIFLLSMVILICVGIFAVYYYQWNSSWSGRVLKKEFYTVHASRNEIKNVYKIYLQDGQWRFSKNIDEVLWYKLEIGDSVIKNSGEYDVHIQKNSN